MKTSEKEKKTDVKPTAVICDDEPIMVMNITEILEGAGFEVVGTGEDGFSAIEECRSKKPDLILMDVKMPLLDGLTAAKVIREEKLCGTVILITAYNDEAYVQSASENGAFGYLVKPVDESTLLATIKIAMARARDIVSLEKEVDKVNKDMTIRKKIERAKGHVMKTRHLAEEEAFNFIRNISRQRNLSMEKVADILLSECETP